jgi:ribulose-5-phosphate 4-epimerase/fuculose-1-phosphate aldolase
MNFAVVRNHHDRVLDDLVDDLTRTCTGHGHTPVPEPNGVGFVFNIVDPQHPRFVRRRSQSLFVFSVIHVEHPDDNLRAICYTALVQTLANQLICVLPGPDGGQEVVFTTPEAGFYHAPYDPERVYQSIIPIAGAHFATENLFTYDLPLEYHQPSPVVNEIITYGKELELMGVLPVPFPLDDVLTEDGRRQLYKIYGITGASYGNLSARETIPSLGHTTFWMTGRGVNKARLSRVGTDILLVRGFDHDNGIAMLSVPPDTDPSARVSVDAVEHSLIYEAFPEVGAIVHAHAWVDGIPCTRQNYPCGTRELAEEVVSLLSKTPDPVHCVVGLKNHGITITGGSLAEIFGRIRGHLRTQVEMFA